jgi:hypothetical protein
MQEWGVGVDTLAAWAPEMHDTTTISDVLCPTPAASLLEPAGSSSIVFIPTVVLANPIVYVND